MTKTKSMSFAGYSFKEWLRRTKDSLKTMVAAAVGFGLWLATQQWPGLANEAFAGVAMAATKWLLDGIDYWLKE